MAFTSSSRLSTVLHPETAEAAVIVFTIVWTLMLKRLRAAFDFGETFFSATKRGIADVADFARKLQDYLRMNPGALSPSFSRPG